MQRSSVLLPEPLGPITQTTYPFGDLEVDAAQHLEVAEALVHALESSSIVRSGMPGQPAPRWNLPCSRAM